MQDKGLTEDISHEEVRGGSMIHVDAPRVISTEEHIKLEVVKFDPIKAGIAAMKRKVKGLKIADENDKEGYKKVKAVWQEIKNTRIAADKLRKELKSDYIAIGKAIEGAYNSIEEQITPLEEPLYKMWKDFDNAAEIKRQVEEKLLQEKVDNRIVELIENGMQFTGSYYTIGENVSLDIVSLKNMTDEDYSSKFLPMVQKINEGIKEEKRKKDEEAESQRQQVENQRKENERKQKELEEQQEVIRKQQEVIDEAKRKQLEERTAFRVKAIEGLKMHYDYNESRWEYNNAAGNLFVTKEDIENTNQDDWEIAFNTISHRVNNLREKQLKLNEQKEAAEKAETERKHRTELRLQELKDKFQMEPVTDSAKSMKAVRFSDFDEIDQIWISLKDVIEVEPDTWQSMIRSIGQQYKDVLAQEEKIRKELDDKKEQERLKTLSDVQIATEYIANFEKFITPIFQNAKVQNIIDNLHNAIADAKTALKNIE